MTAPWWRGGVIYQVYPRSFRDGNGDGVGDLAGIRARLPYLAWLGVDAVWLSPIYRSPMADFGYDVSDHCDVDPLFGTLADWDALADEARRVGLRLILDYVPNHTSSEHPWFAESRAGGGKRDWYIWRDGSPELPPTNWRSVFGGPAWTWDEEAGAWYYHAYLPQQPDLHWRNPAVQEAMLDVLRFWSARGADGFRIDALRQTIKDDRWRDNPADPAWREGGNPYDALIPEFTTDRPEVLDLVARMREAVGPERVLIGELYLPVERLIRYYGAGLDLPSNFHLISLPWEAEAIGAFAAAYETALPAGAWPNWVLGNHDRPRLASRLGPAQARVAAVLLLTLRGTPTLYYGDELGLPDVEVPPHRVQDPWERRVPGQGLGRDPVRTPMPWDDGPNAGFAPPGAEPWLPLADGAAALSVAAQRDDPASLLSLYRRLLSLRRADPALALGSWELLRAEDGVLAYARALGERRVVVALNLTPEPAAVTAGGEVLLGTHGDRAARAAGELRLAGDEAVLLAAG
ncbi:MAG TPA: alpha-amylase family glycosyl hydrolase [Solirubrobacteraceae bacterium]|nr:alpha-amylase family glycosyl hydrolase [Solirubrobacteraceae bacterium]